MPEEYFLTLVGPRVAPAARPWESGLPIEDGHTLPFVVDRGWVGPAGTYIEQWSIRTGETVLYRHPAKYIEVRGFQSVRRFADTVSAPIRLEPGIYDITFVVEDYRMGTFAVEVRPVSEAGGGSPVVEEEATVPAAAPVAAPVAAPPPAAPAAPVPAVPAPVAAPKPTAAAAPAAPTVPYTGEDPAAARKRVYDEELAKGSDPRVAEARSKAAEIKAKRAMAAAAAPAPAAPAPPAPAPAEAPPAPEPAEAPPASPEPAPAEPVAIGLRPGEPLPPSPAPAPEPGSVPALEAEVAAPPPAAPAEDPADVRARVYQEELAKGSDPRVAEARSKSAEIRAKKAASGPPSPTASPAPTAAPQRSPDPPAPPSGAPVASVAPSPLLPGAPEGGGGMTAAEGAAVRAMVLKQELGKGTTPHVAEALANGAEIRAERGPWWRPDW